MTDFKPDQVEFYQHEDIEKIDFRPPLTRWQDTPVDFRPGSWIYPTKHKNLEYLGMPNPREWSPAD